MKAVCGPDGWSASLVKGLRDPLARFLSNIYKSSMKEGNFPKRLKVAYVLGLFKSGDKAMASNYRPIALTSHLSKTMERILRMDIVKYFDENNLWDSRQHGSRGGHSTLTQLLEHYDIIVEALDGGDNLDVIYLDCAKAFDRVDHSILLAKVKAMGIGGQIGKWIGSFLLDRV